MQGKLQKVVCTQIDGATWRFEEKFVGIGVYLYLLLGEEAALLHFPESAELRVFHRSMEQLNQLAETGKVTALFPGHQKTPLSPAILRHYLEASERLLSGNVAPEQIQQGVYAYKDVKIRIGKL